mmetsp:Transcript_120048/g.208964  ORF Transcript_120048/g.208964 Transcript_120048/m.208964 type:complete len:356 (+) Transcript_120048:181-1248(+)
MVPVHGLRGYRSVHRQGVLQRVRHLGVACICHHLCHSPPWGHFLRPCGGQVRAKAGPAGMHGDDDGRHRVFRAHAPGPCRWGHGHSALQCSDGPGHGGRGRRSRNVPGGGQSAFYLRSSDQPCGTGWAVGVCPFSVGCAGPAAGADSAADGQLGLAGPLLARGDPRGPCAVVGLCDGGDGRIPGHGKGPRAASGRGRLAAAVRCLRGDTVRPPRPLARGAAVHRRSGGHGGQLLPAGGVPARLDDNGVPDRPPRRQPVNDYGPGHGGGHHATCRLVRGLFRSGQDEPGPRRCLLRAGPPGLPSLPLASKPHPRRRNVCRIHRPCHRHEQLCLPVVCGAVPGARPWRWPELLLQHR